MTDQRILVFSPHPDDVELFLGGTLLRHVSEGAVVKVVMMTLGEKGSVLSILSSKREASVKQTRAEELRFRFQLAPSVEVALMGITDREIFETEEMIVRVLQEVERFEPTCVYLPESSKANSLYFHPDHIITGKIVESAVARQPRTIARRYFHSSAPTTFIDISDFHLANLTAMRCYKSQYSWTASPPFLLHLLEADRYVRTRRYGKRIGSKFAEAFREA